VATASAARLHSIQAVQRNSLSAVLAVLAAGLFWGTVGPADVRHRAGEHRSVRTDHARHPASRPLGGGARLARSRVARWSAHHTAPDHRIAPERRGPTSSE